MFHMVSSPGENLDLFFYILGAKPDDAGTFSLEIDYEVSQEEELLIQYAAQKYEFPLISQPLPMKMTILKTTEKEGSTEETKETRDLDAGKYTLAIIIKDIISGMTLTKNIEFEVK
ncbi:hypothetical protein ACFLRM_05385 [Acidobacteriota bacterium]